MPTPPSSSKPPIDLRVIDGEVWLGLRAQPKASRNALTVGPDGRIKASVTAPPVDGAANAAVCTLIAEALALPKNAVRLVRGDTSRDKVVAIRGLNETEICNILVGNR